MYQERETRNINWNNVFRKGLIAILILVILFVAIWLITRNQKNNENINVNKVNTSNIMSTYSNEFISSYSYFHDTAKEYLIINTLPENNKSISYSLNDLIMKGIVLPFTYKDNTSCDVYNSKVIVTNKNGKYELTTTLICGNEQATINEELKCSKLCENCGCECDKKVTEYEYKQAYTTNQKVYSCPSGYKLNGTKCVKSNTTYDKLIATKNSECQTGYEKTNVNGVTKCVKSTSSVINSTATTTYSCPSGYTKSGSDSNTACVKTTNESVNAIANTTYSCPSGYTKSGSGSNTTCTKTITDTVNATATSSYKCSKGTLTSDNRCKITTTTSALTCASGYSLSGNSCIKYIYSSISYGSSYQGCTGGQYVANQCASGSCSTGSYVYKCTKLPTETTNTKTSYTNATLTTNYKCQSGYTLNSSNKCVKTTTESVNATAKTTYSCNSGYTLNNSNKCVKTTNESVKPSVKTTYSCSKGYTLNKDNKCTSTSSDIQKLVTTYTYSCNKGFTKVGLGADAKCVNTTSDTINATVSTKKVTKYKYKWSTETELKDWTRTGKTRDVAAKS